MPFSGAVLVDCNKIQGALDNFGEEYKRVKKELTLCAYKAEDEYSTLSWFQKWRYRVEFFAETPSQIYLNSQHPLKYGGESDVYAKLGWMTEEEATFAENMYTNIVIALELDTLIKAGDTVYLSVDQATFVNEWGNNG